MNKYPELYQSALYLRELFKRKILPPNALGSDQPFMKMMMRKNPWTPQEAFRIYNVVKKFEIKLMLIGFDFSKVPKVTMQNNVNSNPPVRHDTRMIGFEDDHFIVTFPYNAQLIEYAKKIPGRRYDGTRRATIVPLTSAKWCQTLIDNHGFIAGDRAMSMMHRIKDNLMASYNAERVELDLPFRINGKSLFNYQTGGVDYGMKNERVIVGDQMGLGKLQPIESKIVTPIGVLRFGELKPGSIIYGRNGKTTTVTNIYPQGIKDIYRVDFMDGSSVECGLEHLWTVRDGNYNRLKRNTGNGWMTLSLGEMLKRGIHDKQGHNKYIIPQQGEVDLPTKDFRVHPYLIGCLIANGYVVEGHGMTLTNGFRDIKINDFIVGGLFCGSGRWSDASVDRLLFSNKLKHAVISEGVVGKSREKRIPEKYLFGDIEQRWYLLRGLMDCDGSCRKNRTTYHTINYDLACDVKQLVHSLGGTCNIREYDRTPEGKPVEYQVNVKTFKNPFLNCDYKRNEWKPCKRNTPKRTICNVEYVGKKESMCIAVDAEDRLYLTGLHYTATHNTIQSIGVVLGKDAFPCIVSCPKSLRYNWVDEWEDWTDKKVIILNDKNIDKIPTLIEMGEVDVMVTNFHAVKKYFIEKIVPMLSTQHFDEKGEPKVVGSRAHPNALAKMIKSCIVDEGHELRNEKTTNFKCHKALMKHMEVRVICTGSPIVNKPNDIASLLDLIGRIDEFGGRFKFNKAFKKLNRDNVGTSKSVADELQNLNIKLRSTCFIRREKFQVLKELPDKFRQIVRVDLDNQKDYDHAFLSLQDWLAVQGKSNEQISRALNAELLVKINVLKQISAKGKLEGAKQFIDEIIREGEKVVIFCWFNDTAQYIKDNFDNVVYINGVMDGKSVTDETIEENKKRFMNDPDAKIMVVTYKKGGVGHTLTSASKVVFIELGWTYKDQSQAEDRCHRIGQMDTVNCYYLLGRNTIDEDIYHIIQSKASLEKQATGGEEEIQTNTFGALREIMMKGGAKT